MAGRSRDESQVHGVWQLFPLYHFGRTLQYADTLSAESHEAISFSSYQSPADHAVRDRDGLTSHRHRDVRCCKHTDKHHPEVVIFVEPDKPRPGKVAPGYPCMASRISYVCLAIQQPHRKLDSTSAVAAECNFCLSNSVLALHTTRARS